MAIQSMKERYTLFLVALLLKDSMPINYPGIKELIIYGNMIKYVTGRVHLTMVIKTAFGQLEMMGIMPNGGIASAITWSPALDFKYYRQPIIGWSFFFELICNL